MSCQPRSSTKNTTILGRSVTCRSCARLTFWAWSPDPMLLHSSDKISNLLFLKDNIETNGLLLI
ncbi:hypothetical protein D3C73_634150 [compost metagenome]